MFIQDFILLKSCFSQRFISKFIIPVWMFLVGTDVLRDVVFHVKENVIFFEFFFKTFIGSKCKHSGKEIANPVSVYTRSFNNSFLWRWYIKFRKNIICVRYANYKKNQIKVVSILIFSPTAGEQDQIEKYCQLFIKKNNPCAVHRPLTL